MCIGKTNKPHVCGVCAWLGIVFISIVLTGITKEVFAARQVAEKRECATCHIASMSEFKRNDVITLVPFEPKPVEKSGRQDVVSTERMCFSCHDGYVLDARYLWQEKGHNHPIGMKPSDKVRIPLEKKDGEVVFPLNDDGNVYCGTCHTAHGVNWEYTSSPAFLREPNINSSICVVCHTDNEKNREGHFNHPLEKIAPEKITELTKVGSQFGDDKELVCQSCHRVHAAREKKLIVKSNKMSELCITCHKEKKPSNEQEDQTHFTHPVNIRPKQAVLSERLAGENSKLGPNGEVVCETCHRTHDAPSEKIVSVDVKTSGGGICLECHENKRDLLANGHNMEQRPGVKADKKNRFAGACGACHETHEGKGPMMWAKEVQNKGDKMAELCSSCHRENGEADKHLVGEFSHPIGVPLKNGANSEQRLPLYQHNGKRSSADGAGNVSCATCHDVHNAGELASKESKHTYLRLYEKEKWKLCKECHEEKWVIKGTKHDLKENSTYSKGKGAGMPGSLDVCGNCHNVHNGMGPRIWARPGVKNGEEIDVLCVDCHKKGKEAGEKVVGHYTHPIGISVNNVGIKATQTTWKTVGVTNEKVELVPLPLYATENSENQGKSQNQKLGCGTCHDPHVWSPLKEGKRNSSKSNSNEGGPESSFLRIAEIGKNGLCVNCHVDKKAIYETKHDLPLNDEKNKQAGNEFKSSASACLACHKTHNATGAALWSRTLGDGEGKIEKMCRDCHRSNGTAREHAVEGYSHPVGLKSREGNKELKLPLFDKEGSIAKKTGVIDCATCHDAHKWNPEEAINASRNMLEEEGSGLNSFLRYPSAPDGTLCTLCHESKKTVVGTDHDLLVTEPGVQNIHGQSPYRAGVCGQCHAAHNATQRKVLWARKTGMGDDEMEKLCRSCHSKGEMAENKVPEAASHPQFVKGWAEELRDERSDSLKQHIPVYSADGEKALIGTISCPSCHNPHQWRADSTERGNGRNEEGDVSSSFLRLSTTEGFLCADCHGLESLYRYKYYHGESTRENSQGN